nr:hypothetical protein [Tanacetum cinerariifolium]
MEAKALKNKSFVEIKELFDKAMARINNFIDFRSELVEENTKKAQAEIAQEKLKRCLEIVPNDGDELTIDATHLSVKTLILNTRSTKKGGKAFSKSSEQMNFDREDLEVLWRLVKDIFIKTKPVDDMDSFILHTLKTMFEHHVKDTVWKSQQGLTKVKSWKLFDSYRVYYVTMQNILYYLLLEKMYPLTNHTLHKMFNNVKLQVDEECEMDFKLLTLIKK